MSLKRALIERWLATAACVACLVTYMFVAFNVEPIVFAESAGTVLLVLAYIAGGVCLLVIASLLWRLTTGRD